MKARRMGIMALGLFLGAFPGGPARAEYTAQEWEILKTGEVVATEVFSTKPDGSKTTDVVVKAWIKAPREEVWAVMRDYNRFAEFFPRVRECRTFKQEGESYWVRYHTEVLGMMVVYHLQLVGVEKFRRIVFSLDPNQPNDVDDTRGFWVFDDAPDGQGTVLTYSIFIDPGLPIPDWLGRKISKPNLVQVVKNVRSRVESGGTWKKPPGS
jgi:uncharacterized protein YndB with AHSA1/START domain